MSDDDDVVIPGLPFPVHVASDEDCEKAAWVVCVPASFPAFPASPPDLIAACSVCGVAIRHRPHVPKTPPKICLQCFMAIEVAEPS